MKKILYIYGGGDEYHSSEKCGRLLQRYLENDGRFELEATSTQSS